jgi:hypothetical protein
MPDSAPEPAQASPLDALRERGAARWAPVRFHLAESLARRAAAHAGAARRVLDDKLARLLDKLATTGDASHEPAQEPAAARSGHGALGELVAHAASRKPPVSVSAKAREATLAPADAGTVQFFKRTWSRLSADQRLAQSRASLPENAGPLNSHHLVHRSLVLMRELSPEYLERFVGYVDALQWLEQANESAPQDGGAATRAASGRKSMAARRG